MKIPQLYVRRSRVHSLPVQTLYLSTIICLETQTLEFKHRLVSVLVEAGYQLTGWQWGYPQMHLHPLGSKPGKSSRRARGTSANMPHSAQPPAAAQVLFTHLPLATASPTIWVWIRCCKPGTDSSKVGSPAMGRVRNQGPPLLPNTKRVLSKISIDLGSKPCVIRPTRTPHFGKLYSMEPFIPSLVATQTPAFPTRATLGGQGPPLS